MFPKREVHFRSTISSKALYQMTQITGSTIELAYIQQLGKQIQIVGSQKGEILRFARIRYEIHCQQHRDHFTISKI